MMLNLRKCKHRTGLAKVAVQCLNQALCFYQSFCLVDSEVLRYRHLRVAAKRWQPLKDNDNIMNKLKNLLIIILGVILLLGCNKIPDKSVFESLTVSELKEAINYDTSFAGSYKYIKHLRDSVITSEIDRVKYSDLTYKRVFKLIKFSDDSTYFKSERNKIDEDWKKKYGGYKVKIDSISNYWKKYKKENSLDQYVKVELVKLEKEYYQYIGGLSEVQVGFKLIPLKGTVQQVRFEYRLEAKINEDKNKESNYYSTYANIYDNSYCLSTTPFSAPIIRYWNANYRNKEILESKSLETLFRDYNVIIEISEIRKDDKNMRLEDLNIPKCIEHHWEYENKEYLHDLYAKDIVKEILNEDYISEYEYREQEIQKILRNKDSLSLDFLQARNIK